MLRAKHLDQQAEAAEYNRMLGATDSELLEVCYRHVPNKLPVDLIDND